MSEHSIDRGRERFLEAWLTNDADAVMRVLAEGELRHHLAAGLAWRVARGVRHLE